MIPLKLLLLILSLLTLHTVLAQSGDTGENTFYVNVFVSADRTIYVETEKTAFEDVEKKLRDLVRNAPFKPDQNIIYRIFGDENLELGYIMDVNEKMLSGYGSNVITYRYLLNTAELNIDGQDWFDSIDLKNLKKLNK